MTKKLTTNKPDDKNLGMLNSIMLEKHRRASSNPTPPSQVRLRPDGFNYVEEAYMREQLNLAYPGLWGWKGDSWKIEGDWVIVAATLWIIEAETLIKREFYSLGAARIQFKRGKPHELANVIDLDKNVASANAFAFKRAVNRLCNVADDIYKKKVELPEPLTDKQKKEIKKLLKEIDNHTLSTDVNTKIHTEVINSLNFKMSLNKLTKMKERKDK